VLQGRSDARISASARALLSATVATSLQVVALLMLAVLDPNMMCGIFRVFCAALR
jgi:hypothetical protein